MIDVGASKLVLIPLGEPRAWHEELHDIAEMALPLEN